MNIYSPIAFPSVKNYKMAAYYGVLFSIGTILAGFLTGELADLYYVDSARDMTAEYGLSLHGLLVLAVFFAPFIETFFYQFLIIEIVGSYTYPRLAVSMGLSTLLFSLSHLSPESSRHAVIALVTGSILSYIYIRASKYSSGLAFVMTSMTHMAHNLIVSIIIVAVR